MPTRHDLPNKQRRTVTSCSECYRRKQKCDRGKPCNFCVRRQVPGRCMYYTAPQRGPRSSIPPSPSPADTASSPTAPFTDYAESIGYATVEENSHHLPAGTSSRQQRYAHQVLHGGTSLSFSRTYRGIIAQLPPHPVLVELLAIFFSEVNAAAQLLERSVFENSLVEWLTLTLPCRPFEELPRHVAYFPPLVFQVLAVAVHFVHQGHEAMLPAEYGDVRKRRDLAQQYSSLGEELLTLLGRQRSTLSGVEHDLLRAYWLKTTGKGTAAWHALGTAIRQAQDQSLHLRGRPPANDSIKPQSELQSEEYRRRLWATLFIWDSHMSLTLTRPRAINQSDCTIERPKDCDLLEPLSPVKLFAYDLGIIINKFLAGGVPNRHSLDYGTVVACQQEAQRLLANSLPSLRPQSTETSLYSGSAQTKMQQLYISIVANSFLLSLYRDRMESGSKEIAIESALKVLEAQEKILAGPSLATGNSSACAYYYSMSCYTMDASIFLSHWLSSSMAQKQQGRNQQTRPVEVKFEERIKQGLHQSIAALETLRERSPLADCGVRILSTAIRALAEDRSGKAKEGGDTRVIPDSSLIPVTPAGAANPRLEWLPRNSLVEIETTTSISRPVLDGFDWTPDTLGTMNSVTLGNCFEPQIFEEILSSVEIPELFYTTFQQE